MKIWQLSSYQLFNVYSQSMDENAPLGCLQIKLEKALKIIRKYDWLIDSYVLDFYVDNHWSKLPKSWRTHLENLEPERLSFLLSLDEKNTNVIWPLSLLALRILFKDLNISRKVQNEESMPQSSLLHHPKLKNIFTKCVKPKKRHEIQKMAALCKRSTEQTAVDFVVDFGAGLGHLARVLGYAYGIQMCCLEMQNTLNQQARVMDTELEKIATKHLISAEYINFRRPTHITLRLTAEMQPNEFVETISNALQLSTIDFSFGIIGLHPCGDLGAILMKMFLACPQAKFLNFVGCCYMKLSTKDAQPYCVSPGYPLSSFLNAEKNTAINGQLSYESREIACHAIEMYCARLRAGNYEYLKIHSYRAAAERILIKYWPKLRHCGLRSVKHNTGMTFNDYFYKAVHGLVASELPSIELETNITTSDLLHWKRVVIFYTLRLMFAPLIESIVLYDRMLFLQENDCNVEINSIFDPQLSPRNHITSAIKKI